MAFSAWFRVGFWLIGILVCIGMTIKYTLPLVDDYHNDNVGAQLKIVANNKTVRPPLMVLRIPRLSFAVKNVASAICSLDTTSRLACNECLALAAHGWDVWTNMSFLENDTHECELRILAMLSKKMLLEEANSDFHILDFSNSEWNTPLVDIAFTLLSCITAHDLSITKSGVLVVDFCGVLDIDLALSARIVDKINDRITDIICNFLTFSILKEDCSQVLAGTLELINGMYFSIQMPFIDHGSFFTFKSDWDKWPFVSDLKKNPINSFLLSEDLDSVMWSVGASEKVVFTSESACTGEEYVKITYSIANTMAERNGVTCFEEPTPTVCYTNCMVREIFRKCRCIPYSLRKSLQQSSDGYSYCKTTNYAVCGMNETDTEKCYDQCLVPCKTSRYAWQVFNTFFPASEFRQFDLILQPLVQPYMEFTSALKTTPDQYFSAVASVFSLFLGVSGLSLISWALISLEVSLRWFRKKWKNQVDVEDFDQSDQSKQSHVDNKEQTRMKKMVAVVAAAASNSSNQDHTDLTRSIRVVMEQQRMDLEESMNRMMHAVMQKIAAVQKQQEEKIHILDQAIDEIRKKFRVDKIRR